MPNYMGQTEPNSQFSTDFCRSCRFSLFLGTAAFGRHRFSQTTAGNRGFQTKRSAEFVVQLLLNPVQLGKHIAWEVDILLEKQNRMKS